LSARVDELTNVVAAVVPQVVQIGVLDGRIVHVDIVVFHKSHRNRRFACAGKFSEIRDVFLQLFRFVCVCFFFFSPFVLSFVTQKTKQFKFKIPTARKPIIANRRFNVAADDAELPAEVDALIVVD
jgi:hypothetical protein